MLVNELFIQFTLRVFREYSSSLCMSIAFWFEGGMWNLIILIPGHCLSIYFKNNSKEINSYTVYAIVNPQRASLCGNRTVSKRLIVCGVVCVWVGGGGGGGGVAGRGGGGG